MKNEEFLIQLKKANFTSINIGLESGSERVRNEILRRPQYKNEDIITFCALARKNGIKVMIYLLMGIPGETKNDFHETIACVRKCDPYSTQLNIFEPYPGTDLYTTSVEQGFFDPKNPEIFKTGRCRAFMDLPHFSKHDIQLEFYLFHFRLWGIIALFRPGSRALMMEWVCDRIFGRLSIFRLFQKIRDKRIGKMQLSNFE